VSAPCVLIVDDNAINVDLVRFVLDADGFKVESVQDPRLAVEHIAQSRPDLILMDIQMPGIDGLELTRRLKSDPAMRDIVVVAFTAYAMKGDEARRHRRGGLHRLCNEGRRGAAALGRLRCLRLQADRRGHLCPNCACAPSRRGGRDSCRAC
jgi:two-component system, cell cycle response regulator DivK